MKLQFFAALAALSFVAPAQASTLTADLTIRIDGAEKVFKYDIEDLRVSQSGLNFVACDGSVLEGRACDGSVVPAGQITLSFQGSMNPTVSMTYAATDFGDPSFIFALLIMPITAIFGNVDTRLEGEIKVPNLEGAGKTAPPAGGSFLTGFINAPEVLNLGYDPLTSNGATTNFGSTTGNWACDPEGCKFISLRLQYQGIGRDTFTVLSGSFSIDPAPPAVIPMPAALWLMLGGLGLLPIVARRRA
jgi:hypothetical protein